MNKLIGFLCLVGGLFLTSCKEKDREVVKQQTPSGFEYFLMEVDEAGVTDTTITLTWPTKWVYTEGLNPAVPLVGINSIKTGGTKDLKHVEILQTFEDKNSYAELSVGPDYVFGEIGFTRSSREEIVNIASEMLAKPQFEANWLERIKQDYIDDLTEVKSNSEYKAWDEARLLVLGDTPLNQYLTLSDLDVFNRVSRDVLHEWHQKTFTRNNVLITVAGAITKEQADKAIDSLIGDLPVGPQIQLPKTSMDFSQDPLHVKEAGLKKSMLGSGLITRIAQLQPELLRI